jgi:hypothetical protein
MNNLVNICGELKYLTRIRVPHSVCDVRRDGCEAIKLETALIKSMNVTCGWQKECKQYLIMTLDRGGEYDAYVGY